MKIGIVCPYAWDVPGGVQGHVRDLAETLISMGHDVSVLAPADDDERLPEYVVSAGKPVSIPYNGSVSKLLLGPVSATRVRRWLRDGDFDVLHVHEPAAPSIALTACWLADGPIVSTHHTSTAKSKAMTAFSSALTTALEKIQGRIAVSEAARQTVMGHMGSDCVIIPNGVDVQRFATALPLDGHPDGETVVFLGRIDEQRKGLPVLLDAFGLLHARRPTAKLLVAGPGDVDEARGLLDPAVAESVTFLGLVSEEDKARLLRSADVFCAPNVGGESFGMVLTEAMAAGACVVASDLDAFRRVLDDGTAGRLFVTGDAGDLAAALGDLLADPAERRRLTAIATKVVEAYDWRTVARDIVAVYETVAGPQHVTVAPDSTKDRA